MCKILAISGSLRQASSNSALLRAAKTLTNAQAAISLCNSLGALPLFNPDIENHPPTSVTYFRSQIATSDAILIASPEYAHGITGALKNALDWVVGSGEFFQKPVAVLNATARSSHAYESLKEILKTMDARIIPTASLIIPLPHNRIDEKEILVDPILSALMREAIQALVHATEKEFANTLH